MDMEKASATNEVVRSALERTGVVDRLVRTSGSNLVNADEFLSGDIYNLLMGLEYTEITDEVKKIGASFGTCRYFKAQLGDLAAYMSATNIEDMFQSRTGMSIDDWDAKTDGQERARIAKIGEELMQTLTPSWGQHGPELNADIPKVSVDFITVIVGRGDNPFGEHNGNEVIFTWHPGMPVNPVKLSQVTVKL